MSRAERVKQIQALRTRGLSQREIGERLGLARRTVSAYIVDPSGAKNRARKRSYGGTCQGCGNRTDGSNGRARAPRWCVHCEPREPWKWPKERILEAIRDWAAEHGESPAATDWNSFARAQRGRDEGRWPDFTTVVRRFGSWNLAIAAAGFEPRAAHGGAGNWRRTRRARERVTA